MFCFVTVFFMSVLLWFRSRLQLCMFKEQGIWVSGTPAQVRGSNWGREREKERKKGRGR